MRHVRVFRMVLAAIAGIAAAPADAMPRAALPAKAAPIVLVDMSPRRGGPGAGLSPGDAVAIGGAIGALLGAVSQPAPQPAPPPAYYPPPAYQPQPAYNPPPPTYSPPAPPTYSAAPPVSDTPIPNPSPASVGAAIGAGTGPAYQAALKDMPASASDTLNTTVAATPPPTDPNLTVQQIVEANRAAGDPTKAIDAAIRVLWPPPYVGDPVWEAHVKRENEFQKAVLLDSLNRAKEDQENQEKILRTKWEKLGLLKPPPPPPSSSGSAPPEKAKSMDQVFDDLIGK